MRLFLLLPAAGILGAALFLPRGSTRSPAAAERTVSVTAVCSGASVTFTVNPWVLRLTLGDSVAWQLTANSNADSIWVDRKRGPRWPFVRAPRGGKRGQAARSGGPAELRGRHQYNINLLCTLGTDTVTIVVDPDMVIE